MTPEIRPSISSASSASLTPQLILCFTHSPEHLPPFRTHSHLIAARCGCGLHSVPPSTSLWQKCPSSVSRSRRSAAAYRELSPIMLRAMRRVDQMLSDIMVAAATPGPRVALAPSTIAWRCRDRASRKCSTASLKGEGLEVEKQNKTCFLTDLNLHESNTLVYGQKKKINYLLQDWITTQTCNGVISATIKITKMLLPSSGNICNCTASYLGKNNNPLLTWIMDDGIFFLNICNFNSTWLLNYRISNNHVRIYCTQSMHAVFSQHL